MLKQQYTDTGLSLIKRYKDNITRINKNNNLLESNLLDNIVFIKNFLQYIFIFTLIIISFTAYLIIITLDEKVKGLNEIDEDTKDLDNAESIDTSSTYNQENSTINSDNSSSDSDTTSEATSDNSEIELYTFSKADMETISSIELIDNDKETTSQLLNTDTNTPLSYVDVDYVKILNMEFFIENNFVNNTELLAGTEDVFDPKLAATIVKEFVNSSFTNEEDDRKHLEEVIRNYKSNTIGNRSDYIYLPSEYEGDKTTTTLKGFKSNDEI
ncbi:MAG: hypothetical protein EOP34_00160 [Rickettsiales bacterium]|nr:MAG: hypothetical protein EOP34_00160 [Rickettsiales bacterium]